MKSFDLNADGVIDEEELTKGARKLFYQSKNAIGPDEKPEPVALQGAFRHDPTHGLIIGDSHQSQLSKKIGSRNALSIIGGATMIAAGCAILASFFRM